MAVDKKREKKKNGKKLQMFHEPVAIKESGPHLADMSLKNLFAPVWRGWNSPRRTEELIGTWLPFAGDDEKVQPQDAHTQAVQTQGRLWLEPGDGVRSGVGWGGKRDAAEGQSKG